MRPDCLRESISRLSSTIHPHDAGGDSRGLAGAVGDPAAIARTLPPQGLDWIRSSYRFLMIKGLDPVAAGNIVAWTAGLHAAAGGWKVKEIERLVALRSLVECGRVES